MVGTRKEVAKLANVSEATVSRVLNGVGPIKEETRNRVLAAARKLNYHPSAIAQSFARGKSMNMGVVLPYVPKVRLFSTYYFSEILSGIGEALQQRGYGLLMLFRSPEEPMDYESLYLMQKVDACIILGSRDVEWERNSLRRLTERNMPFCLVNQHFEHERFNEVDADHVTGSYEAVKHLIGRGYRNIAFLNGPMTYSNSTDRERGYVEALREAGIPLREELMFHGNYSRTSGYQAAAGICAGLGRIDAVFAANDRMAIGLMQGLREAGCMPGRDIAVVGYDNSDASTLTDPPLTTVEVPFFEMGRLAASNLLDYLERDSEWDDRFFAEKLRTRLIVRSSSNY